MRQEGVAGLVARTIRGAADGGRQEEVLHVDDDEGGFGGVDGDGGRGGCEVEARRDGWGGGGCGVGEVEAVGGSVEPEVGGGAEDGGVVGWKLVVEAGAEGGGHFGMVGREVGMEGGVFWEWWVGLDGDERTDWD